MKYNFKKYKISNSIFYDVDVEDNAHYILTLFRFSAWKPNMIQDIIEGISSTLQSDKVYKFQTEGDDLYIYSNSFGVQLFNLKSQNKEADLVLEHDIFIRFLKDFKKFVGENS